VFACACVARVRVAQCVCGARVRVLCACACVMILIHDTTIDADFTIDTSIDYHGIVYVISRC